MTGWKRALAEAVTDVDELLALVRVDRDQLPPLWPRCPGFGLRVPRDFVARMVPGDPADPLLRQVLPLRCEADAVDGFAVDPLSEHRLEAPGGILRKYRGRSLVVVSGACAVHCRYCFRRHYPYAGGAAAGARWRETVAAVAADPECREVILSGGDPLTVDDRQLERLVARLEELPHLQRLRLHTRLPVMIPARVTGRLLAVLAGTRLRTVVVIHANHAREIDRRVGDGVARLRGTGATVLNQAVLLGGVNDSVEALCALSEALFAAGALPYYLHCLDRVQGAGHFEVDDHRARALVAGVRSRLPGYLVPRLVRERPGADAKEPLED